MRYLLQVIFFLTTGGVILIIAELTVVTVDTFFPTRTCICAVEFVLDAGAPTGFTLSSAATAH